MNNDERLNDVMEFLLEYKQELLELASKRRREQKEEDARCAAQYAESQKSKHLFRAPELRDKEETKLA